MVQNRALVAGLLAVAAAASAFAAPPTSVGKSEGQLNIIAWAGYIERGETVKEYDWTTGFEKASGCKVNVKTAATSDEMVSLMKAGGYDLVTASGDASGRLIASKLVQEVNVGSGAQLQEHRHTPAKRSLAHSGRQTLRCSLPVRPQRADVQHRRIQEGARLLGRGV